VKRFGGEPTASGCHHLSLFAGYAQPIIEEYILNLVMHIPSYPLKQTCGKPLKKWLYLP
jgi:hypothetical protein